MTLEISSGFSFLCCIMIDLRLLSNQRSGTYRGGLLTDYVGADKGAASRLFGIYVHLTCRLSCTVGHDCKLSSRLLLVCAKIKMRQ